MLLATVAAALPRSPTRAGLGGTLSPSLVRCSCFKSSSRCFWKNSGSLKHFSRLAARCKVVGELGVERENSSSSRSRFSVLLLHIRGGSRSRNALRCPFDISHIATLTSVTKMGYFSSLARSFATCVQPHYANIFRTSLKEQLRLFHALDAHCRLYI